MHRMEETTDKKTSVRRTEIDVAKGFALFLVVFGHVLDTLYGPIGFLCFTCRSFFSCQV